MNTINNMKMRTKIMTISFSLISLMLVVALYSIFSMRSIGDEIREVAEEDIPLMEVISAITSQQIETALWTERGLRHGDKGEKEQLKTAEKEIDRIGEEISEDLLKVEKIVEEGIRKAHTSDTKNKFTTIDKHLKTIDKEHSGYESDVKHIFTLLRQGKIYEADRLALKAEKKAGDIDRELNKFSENIKKFTEKSALNAEHHIQSALLTIIALMIVALLLGTLLSLLISGNITKRLVECLTIANRIADNDLTIQIRATGDDEIGHLVSANAVMVKKLTEMINTIQVSSKNIFAGAEQISSSAQQSAQGANEQAAATEEISSSITEVSASIQQVTASVTEIAQQTKQSAENTNEVQKVSKESLENANLGAEKMNEMVSTMNNISDSSKNIFKIMKTIDEIAFQTNLLALNAAVEAARAGKHGRGFAVVAEEVNNLSKRSSQAAKETADIIENSINKIEEGKSTATNTQEAFQGILERIQRVSELTKEISMASVQQVTGIEQIETGIHQVERGIQQVENGTEQINTVTQQSASSSEESASSSEELTGLAKQLMELASQFKIEKNGGSKKHFSQELQSNKSGHSNVEDRRVVANEFRESESFGKMKGRVIKPKEIITLNLEEEKEKLKKKDFEKF